MNIQTIVDRLKETLAVDGKNISLHEPTFSGNEWNYVKECLDTGWVSSVGKFVDKFEQDLSDFTGAKHAVAVVNGTAALHVSYLLAGVQPGDEVLVPTLTFIGTINPIHYCGAIPHFIDAEEKTLGLNAKLIDAYLNEIVEIKSQQSINRITGRPIRALCVMHTLGHPIDLDPIVELCEKYHLTLIEDAAEALGSYYKGTHVGHKGLIGALSFNGNKTITTGGGGAILTNHTEIAKKAKHITTTAKLPHSWAFIHDQVGYNYRLPNLNAAVGCAQLEKLPDFLHAKRVLADTYQSIFSTITGVRFLQEPAFGKSNYWLNALLLDEAFADQRDPFLELFGKNGMMTRPLWNLQHTLSMYQDCPRMPVPVAESLFKRLIKIPSSASLGMSLIQKNITVESI